MGNTVRTYLNTLLHRKRGAYGPLWVFELDPETWVIVWSNWLGDEAICRLILSEDPEWFNREWGMDGRRPNPTYRTQHDVLQEVIRLLRSMQNELKDDATEQTRYTVYISNAEHDLNQTLTGQLSHTLREDEQITRVSESVALQEAIQAAQTPGPAQPPAKPAEMAPAPALQAAEVIPQPKPWDNPTEKPKGLNFQPTEVLHAKMEWVCHNVPKMSRLRIAREGAELLCDQLIAKHYKDEK